MIRTEQNERGGSVSQERSGIVWIAGEGPCAIRRWGTQNTRMNVQKGDM